MEINEIDRPIAIAVILFVVLILGFYLVLPKYQEFRELLVQLSNKEAEFQARDAYFVEVTKAYKELMQNQEALKKIESALPSRFSVATLVNLLSKKAAENGVIVEKITINKGTGVGTETNVYENNISLNLTSSYDSFKKFLVALEKSARLIEAERFSFAITPPTTQSPQVATLTSFTLSIKVYSY